MPEATKLDTVQHFPGGTATLVSGARSRRFLLSRLGALSAMAGTAVLAACGATASSNKPNQVTGATSGNAEKQAAQAPQTNQAPARTLAPAAIQFWPTWSGKFQVDGMNALIEAFQQDVPQVTVEMTPFSGKYDKIVTAVAGGNAPDVATVASGKLPEFARSKIVQAFDSRLAKSSIARRDKFYPAQWESASWEGKVYGLPAMENGPSPFLFWNQAHFEEKGLPADRPPADLDEARHYAELLTVQQPGGKIERLGWEPLTEAGNSLLGYWSLAYRATWYDPKNKKIDLVKPEYVAAVEYIAGVTKQVGAENIAEYRKVYKRWNAPDAGMAQGAESMKVSSYVSAGTLANNAPDQRIAIGWAPPQKRGATFVEVGNGWNVSLATGAAQGDAGFRFMEWLTTPRASQLLLDNIGWIAFNKEVAEKLNVEKYPTLRIALDAPAKAKQISAPTFLPIDTGPVTAGINDVITGKLSAKEMLQQVTQQLQNDLDNVLRS